MNDKNTANLVEEPLGSLWHFYISDRQQLMYSYKKDMVWTEPEPVDAQPVKFFSAAIDNDDRICLLACTQTKQIRFYTWNRNQWQSSLIYRISSRFENISFLSLLTITGELHLLYYIESSLKRSQEALAHFYLKDGEWKQGELLYFLSDQSITPQILGNDANGGLYFIYTKKVQNIVHCYIRRLGKGSPVWSNPSLIFQTSGSCSDFRSYSDSACDIDLVWQEKLADQYSIYYRKIYADPFTVRIHTKEELVHTSSTKAENLTVIGGSSIMCCWQEGDKSLYCESPDSGREWHTPQAIINYPLSAYTHTTKTLDNNTNEICLLGDGYPNFKWSVKKLSENPAEADIISDRKAGNTMDDIKASKTHTTGDSRQNTVKTRETAAAASDKSEHLAKRIEEIAAQMDDIYTALYQLRDYIQQRDKSLYQMDARLKKLTFEVEQGRSSLYAGNKKYETVPDVIIENPENENKDETRDKNREVKLGNATIIINPEDEAEDI